MIESILFFKTLNKNLVTPTQHLDYYYYTNNTSNKNLEIELDFKIFLLVTFSKNQVECDI